MEVMETIPDNSIDAVIADLPISSTFRLRWDLVIPFMQMWESLNRIGRKGCPFVLMTRQPQTSFLILSNKRKFRYCWVFERSIASVGARLKTEPFQKHEDICVFGEKTDAYHPQMIKKDDFSYDASAGVVDPISGTSTIWGERPSYPSSVLRFSNTYAGRHPSLAREKPLKLMRFLLRTYTKRGDTVLDFCMGGGSTIVAAKTMGRHSIGIEIEKRKFERAEIRVRNAEQGATDDQNEGPHIERFALTPKGSSR